MHQSSAHMAILRPNILHPSQPQLQDDVFRKLPAPVARTVHARRRAMIQHASAAHLRRSGSLKRLRIAGVCPGQPKVKLVPFQVSLRARSATVITWSASPRLYTAPCALQAMAIRWVFWDKLFWVACVIFTRGDGFSCTSLNPRCRPVCITALSCVNLRYCTILQ